MVTLTACTAGSATGPSENADGSTNSSASNSVPVDSPSGTAPFESSTGPIEPTTPPSVPSDGAPGSLAGPSADEVTPTVTVSTSGPVVSQGNINETVPDIAGVTNAPVPMDGQGDFGGQVQVRLAEIRAIDGSARLPGEISGPAVALAVEIANNSPEAVGLDAVSVNMAAADGTPFSSISTDPAAPLAGVLNPGETRSGVYVFTVAPGARQDVEIDVSYSAGSPTVVFSGSVPGG